MMAKRWPARKILFSQVEIYAMKTRGTLRPNESFGKTHRVEKLKGGNFCHQFRQFHMIKSNKEVTLKTRETYFLYRKAQKLKTAKNFLRKLFQKIY